MRASKIDAAKKQVEQRHHFSMVVLVALLTLTLIAVTASHARAQSGAVALATGASNQAAGIAVAPDGQIYIGASADRPGSNGNSSDFEITGLTSRGQLNPAFRRGAVAGQLLDLGGDDEAQDLAVDSAGRIVQVGCSKQGARDLLAVVRYLPNGVPDSSWGSGGLSLTPMTSGSCASTVAIQPDGKIAVAGQVGRGNDEGGSTAFFTRFLVSGQLDPGFGFREISFEGYDDQVSDLALQPDGKIVGVGQTTSWGETSYRAVIVRLLANGTPDNSFGPEGVAAVGGDWTALYSVGVRGPEIVASGISGRGQSKALVLTVSDSGAVQGQQTIPLLSRLVNSAGFRQLVGKYQLDIAAKKKLARYLSLGDGSFAGALQSSGRSLLASSTGYSITAIADSGQVDPGFGQALTPGLSLLVPSASNYLSFGDDFARIAVQPDGKIIGVGGAAFGGLGVVRWLADGRLDPSFGRPSLRVREARVQLQSAGPQQVKLDVGHEAVGGVAKLTLATSHHRCRFVNFPEGASAPDGNYCQWQIVGKPKTQKIQLRDQQLLDLPGASGDYRILVGLKVASFDQAYGRVVGTSLKAVVSGAGIKVCSQGGRYACGAAD